MMATSDTDSTKQMYAMAFRLYESSNYREALHYFKLLSVMDGNDPKHWLGLGACYQMTHAYNEALQSYGLAALLDETDPLVHYHAAECFIALKRYDEAKKAISMAEKNSKNKKKYEELIVQLKHLKAEYKGKNSESRIQNSE